MESVSLILIAVGAMIIAVVLLLRLGLRRGKAETNAAGAEGGKNIRLEVGEPDYDPLFAIDAKKEEISGSALADMGRIVAARDAAPLAAAASPAPAAGLGGEQVLSPRPVARRRPPRVADDPQRVVVLNVMAAQDRSFVGGAVRDALENSGFEYGEWQIFHYYSPAADAPPLFSLANMVKPGNFELERMDELHTAGLSLFMVPAGAEDDIAAFDTMLATAGRLAEELDGEVRDARRSVLTRQAIAHIREQLNEWRCRAQVAQH